MKFLKLCSIIFFFGLLNINSVQAENCGNVINIDNESGGGGSDGTIPNPNPADLPDLIVHKIWLETPWGTETYKYGSPEIMKAGAQFKNTGTGDPNQQIEVHFYLSKGYKEDPHSGDGSWTRVGTDYIKPENLKAGMTHTETEGIELWRDIPEPGIWNITAYIDHTRDDHNEGGDIEEEYESNNGSTEAVFEVTADGKVVNIPNVDFVTSGLNFRGTPPYYAGDQAHFGAWIINQGTIGSTADIRSSYNLLCPDSKTIYLADDGTMASTLSAGAWAFEENLGAINLPNVPGNYTAYFCADYQNSVQEINETNNCTSFSFALQPRPKPNLLMTKFQDEVGCCTTNTGSRIKPNVWVKNTGLVAPGANVIILYQIRSPIATGNQWWNIGQSIIEPRELPPGGTDEDYMEGGGWTIPNNSAWKKQWHEIRACIRSDGSYPTGDPNRGDNCLSYVRYSKK